MGGGVRLVGEVRMGWKTAGAGVGVELRTKVQAKSNRGQHKAHEVLGVMVSDWPKA